MESFYGIAASPSAEDPVAASLDVIRAETGDLADLRAILDLPALIDSMMPLFTYLVLGKQLQEQKPHRLDWLRYQQK